MAVLNISDDLYEQIDGFKQVIEAVLEEPIEKETCTELILRRGIDFMLAELLAPVDQEILVNSFQQLGAAYPKQIYKFVAETLMRGKEVQERERLKRLTGFYKEK